MLLTLKPAGAHTGALEGIVRFTNSTELMDVREPLFARGNMRLQTPVPVPRRRTFCVGDNSHAHPRESSSSVVEDSRANPKPCPIV